MKKIFILFLISNFLASPAGGSLLISPAYAATPTPSPEDKIQEIRDRLITNIASRVAQLKLVEKRGIIGKVTDVTNTQITVTDLQNNIRFIDVDELTKFSSPNTEGTFGISDITKDETLGILGLYNKESRKILARFVNVITAPATFHGGILSIDNEEFTIDIATEEGVQMTVDIENITRTYSYTQKDGYVRSGFSKFKENYNIIVKGVLNKEDKAKMTATKVIFFPEIPPSPKVSAALNEALK